MGTGNQKNVLVPFLVIGWEKFGRGDKDKDVNVLQTFWCIKFLIVILGSQCK